MIRVLITDDSPVVQRTLTRLLSDEPTIKVVGVASNGAEAVQMCRELRPDLVTMDVYMPEMDGLEATRRIMETNPTRIVIVSSTVDAEGIRASFDAICSGAVEVIEKPHGVLRGDYSQVQKNLVQVIREMTEAVSLHPISLKPPRRDAAQPAVTQGGEVSALRVAETTECSTFPKAFFPEIVCFGGSTGAPAVLGSVLSSLSADYPIPIVVAQHMARGFMRGMAEWLNSLSALEVRIAGELEQLKPGQVLVAPDHAHLKVHSIGRLELSKPGTLGELTPSVDVLLESVADVYRSRAVGIILSGMGRDGSSGLLKMREAGAFTVAQDEPSSVVYGMPMAAVEIGAAWCQISRWQMGELLNRLGRSGASGPAQQSRPKREGGAR